MPQTGRWGPLSLPPPLTCDIVPLVRAHAWPPNLRSCTHSRGLPPGAGCSLGLGDRGRATSATTAKAGLTRALAGWVSQQLPGFPFTSIHVNIDSQAGIHIDEANTGMAAVWAGGDFRGGRLIVIPPDYQPMAVSVDQQWAFLKPFTAHAVEGWVGRRISLVACWRDTRSLPG